MTEKLTKEEVLKEQNYLKKLRDGCRGNSQRIMPLELAENLCHTVLELQRLRKEELKYMYSVLDTQGIKDHEHFKAIAEVE